MIKNKIFTYSLLTLCLLVVFSCGSKSVLGPGEIKSDLPAKKIIKAHYKNASDFETLSGRIKINYNNGETSQGVTVSLRMKKDEIIWISAPLSVVKAIITPTRVSFYNKLDNTYFDGDFSYLNKLLGTELNYQMIQNLLLGQAILDLNDQAYFAASVANKYQLKPKKQSSLLKTLFLLEPTHFKVALQQISQPQNDRLLSIDYKNYQTVNGKVIPNEIQINATDKKHKNLIEIEYNNIKFNKQVSFPYEIPSGFKQIEME